MESLVNPHTSRRPYEEKMPDYFTQVVSWIASLGSCGGRNSDDLLVLALARNASPTGIGYYYSGRNRGSKMWVMKSRDGAKAGCSLFCESRLIQSFGTGAVVPKRTVFSHRVPFGRRAASKICCYMIASRIDSVGG